MFFLIFITKKYERGLWLTHYLWLSASSAPPRDDFSYVFLNIPLNFKLLTANYFDTMLILCGSKLIFFR
jgi:hypothetical protein